MTAKPEREPEREIDERLADWVDGRLSDRERERFTAELRVNPRLRKDLEQYEQTVATLRAALRAPTSPVRMADRVLSAIAAGKQAGAEARPRSRYRPLLWSLASAAALLVVALWVNSWLPQPAALDTVAQEAPGHPETDKGSTGADDLNAQFATGGAADSKPTAKILLTDASRSADQPPVGAANAAPEDPGIAAAAAKPAAPAPGEESPRPGESKKSDGGLRLGAARRAEESPSREGATEGTEKSVSVPVQPVGTEDPVARPAGEVPGDGKQARATASPIGRSNQKAHEGGEPLPVVIVHGAAIAAAPKLEQQQPVPAAPAGPASGARSKDEAAGQAELLARLDAFFKNQMTVSAEVAAEIDAVAQDWTAGARLLRLTPLRDMPAVAGVGGVGDSGSKDSESKERGEQSRGDVRGGEQYRRNEPSPVERGWLVEGSKEDLQLLLRRLATFAQSANLQLTNGETSEVPLAQQELQAAPGPKQAEARPLPAARLVLRFRIRPR